MKYTDLENEGKPLEERIKHLEREAAHVRDAMSSIRASLWGLSVFGTIAFIVLSIAVGIAYVMP